MCQWCGVRNADCEAHIQGEGEIGSQLFKDVFGNDLKIAVPKDQEFQFDPNRSYGITCQHCDNNDLRILEESDNPLITLWKIAAYYHFSLKHDPDHKMTQKEIPSHTRVKFGGYSDLFPGQLLNTITLEESILVRDKIRRYISGEEKSQLVSVNVYQMVDHLSVRFVTTFPQWWNMMETVREEFTIGSIGWGTQISGHLAVDIGGAILSNKKSEYSLKTKHGEFLIRRYPPRYICFSSGHMRHVISITDEQPTSGDIVADYFEDTYNQRFEDHKLRAKVWRRNNKRR